MALRLATAATSDPSGESSEAEPLIRKRTLTSFGPYSMLSNGMLPKQQDMQWD